MAKKIERMRFIILIMLLKQVNTLIDKAWCYHTHSSDYVGECVTSVTMAQNSHQRYPKDSKLKEALQEIWHT